MRREMVVEAIAPYGRNCEPRKERTAGLVIFLAGNVVSYVRYWDLVGTVFFFFIKPWTK